MKIPAETLSALCALHNAEMAALKREQDIDPDPDRAPPMSAEQITAIEARLGGRLPADVRQFFESPAIYGSVRGFVKIPVEGDREEVDIEGFPGAEELIAVNENLAAARDEYEHFRDLPPCVVLSLNNNEFIASRLEDSTMFWIDGDDAEVVDLGLTFAEFLERYRDALASRAES